MEYVVVIHAAEEGGYWAEAPSLDGCFAQGETIEDVLEEMKGAIASHLEALRAEGRQVPMGQDVLIATIRVDEPSAA
jgi:predicted RNase H-like HicB family nuclease